ncbi:hypothetical protein NKH77_00545 [Streptomyces sp. M19]
MTNASVARFFLLALLWGSSFMLIKVSLDGLTPGQLVLARLILGPPCWRWWPRCER